MSSMPLLYNFTIILPKESIEFEYEISRTLGELINHIKNQLPPDNEFSLFILKVTFSVYSSLQDFLIIYCS